MKDKLQEYALVAEIISAIAIVLSLIFVGLQVKTGAEETAVNTRALEATVRESMLNSDNTTLLKMMDYPYLWISENRDFDPTKFSDEELQRAEIFFFTFVRSRENFWSQYQNGIIDTDTYYSYREALIYYLTNSDFYLNLPLELTCDGEKAPLHKKKRIFHSLFVFCHHSYRNCGTYRFL